MRSWTLRVLEIVVALAWGCAATAQEGPRAGIDPLALDRFSLMYSPEILLSSGSLGESINRAAQGAGVHNIGLELSSQTGWFARYHAQLAYTYGYGVSGVRLEPLGFGWAFPLLRAPGLSLEIEPLISLADGILLFTNDDARGSNVTFLLGLGAEAQVNLVVGPLYAYLSPIGVELRYLEITSGAGGGTTTGGDAFWRFRIGIGVQY